MNRVVNIRKRASGIVAAAILATFSLTLSAQNGVESGTPFGRGDDSLRCLDNTLRYTAGFENRDFITALGFWRQVASECPASSEDLYIKGEAMYTELYEVTGRKEYIDTVLLTLSQRT